MTSDTVVRESKQGQPLSSLNLPLFGGESAPSSLSDAPVLIHVDNVSKQFIRRTGQAGDLRERFGEWYGHWKGRGQPSPAPSSKTFWALQDVSFQVREGESVGIVGHNGSGKSTILKMLTSILQPTRGQVSVKGRVGALIEVGAGFHPDLTGRENIFLNGSILGMSRRQIQQRLDQIIDFSGLEAFIDTPVKRYSSGMYMRLGFAVATHTDPDILLIDEVLAVGDMQFQRKCLRHLQEWQAKGGTLVFVSHAMDQMQAICQKCVWLDHGQVRFQGSTAEAIDHYISMVNERDEAEYRRLHPREWEQGERERDEERKQAEEQVRQNREAAQRRETERRANPQESCLLDWGLCDAEGKPALQFAAGSACQVHVRYRVPDARENLVVSLDVLRQDGSCLFSASNFKDNVSFPTPAGIGLLQFDIPFLGLQPGEYYIRLSLLPDPKIPGENAVPEHTLDTAVFQVTTAQSGAYIPVQARRIS